MIVEPKDCSEVNKSERQSFPAWSNRIHKSIDQWYRASKFTGRPSSSLSTFPLYRPAEAKGNNTLQSPFLIVIAGSLANLASIPACALIRFPSIGDYVGDKSGVTPKSPY